MPVPSVPTNLVHKSIACLPFVGSTIATNLATKKANVRASNPAFQATLLELSRPSTFVRNVALVGVAVSASTVFLAVVVTLGYVAIPGLSSNIIMYIGVAGAGGTFISTVVLMVQQARIHGHSKREGDFGARQGTMVTHYPKGLRETSGRQDLELDSEGDD